MNAQAGKKLKEKKGGKEEIPFHFVCLPKHKWYLVQELLLSYPLTILTLMLFLCIHMSLNYFNHFVSKHLFSCHAH